MMAQIPTPLPHAQQALHLRQLGTDGIGVSVARLPQRVAHQLVRAGFFLSLAYAVQAPALAQVEPLYQTVPLHCAGPGAVGAGALQLNSEPRPDWLTGLVEFFSAVPPECSSVSKQNTQQKCQERERGVLERFKDRHPVAFNLLVAGITLLAGFYIGGGFERK